ncbi:MAG TPA: class I tRNA ligase family protein, partial [Candidatus Binatia bacterium]
LVHLIAPILSFTAEEIWQHLPGDANRLKSVFLSQIPEPDSSFADDALAVTWNQIMRERGEVLKALEQARAANIIGHSLDAKVVFENLNGGGDQLLPGMVEEKRNLVQDILIVSQAHRESQGGAAAAGPESSYDAPLLNCLVRVTKADGTKCERCWKYDVQVGADRNHPTVCARCASVLNAGASA